MSPTPKVSTPTAPPPDALGEALRQHWQATEEPRDDGFSLGVMAALPPRRPSRARGAAALRGARWTALSLAASGAASLLSGASGPLDTPHAVAAACLLGLVIFWSLPTRWNRG